MRAVVVAIFEDPARAEQVRQSCSCASGSCVVDCGKIVVVERGADGVVHLHYAHNFAADGALIGGVWGGLTGLLFLNPLLGAMVGAGIGAIAGNLGDTSVVKGFIREFSGHLKPGSSALIVPTSADQIEIVKALLRPLSAVLLDTRLTADDEEALLKTSQL